MKIAMAGLGQIISSSTNALLKDVRRAASRGALTSDGYLVAESFHLLDEALRSGSEFKTVLASESASNSVEKRLKGRGGIPIRMVEDSIFSKIASTETSQGVIALVRPPSWTINDVFGGNSLVVVLDGLQDPGNAGAIVRAAEAFGATGVLFMRATASPANTKCLRASAGSLFRIPFLDGVARDELNTALRKRGIEKFAASPRGEVLLPECDLKVPSVLIIGSEAHGVSERLLEGTRTLRIPTAGVESLNASVAAGVILYEAARQRARSPKAKRGAEQP